MVSPLRENIPTKPETLQVSRNGYRGFQSKREYDWLEHAFQNWAVVIESPVTIGAIDNFVYTKMIEQRAG